MKNAILTKPREQCEIGAVPTLKVVRGRGRGSGIEGNSLLVAAPEDKGGEKKNGKVKPPVPALAGKEPKTNGYHYPSMAFPTQEKRARFEDMTPFSSGFC